jgi:hypothetical protein
MSECGWKFINWFVKMMPSCEMSESGWKFINWLVEPISSCEMGECEWKFVNWFVKFVSYYQTQVRYLRRNWRVSVYNSFVWRKSGHVLSKWYSKRIQINTKKKEEGKKEKEKGDWNRSGDRVGQSGDRVTEWTEW